MPTEAAALLLAWLEARGAIATLSWDDLVHVDLNPVCGFGTMTPDQAAEIAMTFIDEIRQIVIARRVTH